MARTVELLAKPFVPSFHAIRNYSLSKLRHDLVAGLTVSVVEVPQAMAYALIAGVPPQYGLYTSVIQGVLGAMLSSAEHLTTGPTNTQSLLIYAAVARLAGLDGPRYLELVFALTVLKGIIQLAFAAAGLGNMVRYISRSVIVGVSAGAGVLIIVGQLPGFLGISLQPLENELPGVLGSLQRLCPHLGQLNWHAVLIGMAVLVLVLGIRAIHRMLPGALVGVILSAAAVAALGWIDQLPLVGALPQGLPSFHVPRVSFLDIEDLLSGAVALAILGMLESVAIGKTLAARTGERINSNQEFFAQGMTNLVAGFFRCIPGSGSFTRSALDYDAGAKTRFAAVYNAIFVGAIFLAGAQYARYIPLSSLAAVLFVIALGLIDWRYVARAAATRRSDLAVFAVTFLATLLAPLQYAIFIGIFLNIALYMRTASRLHVAEIVPSAGPFIERPLHNRKGGHLLFLNIEGDLFFGLADELHDRLSAIVRSDVQIAILRLRRTRSVDTTVLSVLEQFVRDMQGLGRHVLLCGIRAEVAKTLGGYGLSGLVGPANLFAVSPGLFDSARRALDRARELLGSTVDAEGIDDGDEESASFVKSDGASPRRLA